MSWLRSLVSSFTPRFKCLGALILLDVSGAFGDLEFRYAVCGLIGLDGVLERLDEHGRKFSEVWLRLGVLGC